MYWDYTWVIVKSAMSHLISFFSVIPRTCLIILLHLWQWIRLAIPMATQIMTTLAFHIKCIGTIPVICKTALSHLDFLSSHDIQDLFDHSNTSGSGSGLPYLWPHKLWQPWAFHIKCFGTIPVIHKIRMSHLISFLLLISRTCLIILTPLAVDQACHTHGHTNYRQL